MTIKKYFPWFILLIALISWLIILGLISVGDDEPLAETIIADEEYRMKGVKLRDFNENGILTHAIKAEEISVLNETGVIVSPYIMTTINDSTWVIKANKAITENHRESIFLERNVSVSSKPSLKNSPVSLETENLLYSVLNKELSTNANVKFHKDSTTLTGQGLTINLDKQTFHIKENVVGIQPDDKN